MIKFVFKGIVVLLFILSIVVAYGAYKVKKEVGSLEYQPVKSHYLTKWRDDLSAEEKEALKGKAMKAKDKVYEEATEHNPEGDMLPDEIDDTIKEKIKEEVK
ncbi:hypothetical protein KKC60_03110 [Patescibacteria group bacterium]|nr:hypothetical protein [Patescibacteria group bacterium]